jgi:hypothetical protein
MKLIVGAFDYLLNFRMMFLSLFVVVSLASSSYAFFQFYP